MIDQRDRLLNSYALAAATSLFVVAATSAAFFLPISPDEAVTLDILHGFPITVLVDCVINARLPFYYLVAYVANLAGFGLETIRLLSVLCGLAAVVAAGFVPRAAGMKNSGLAALALCVFPPFLIVSSHAGPTAMGCMFFFGSLLCLHLHVYERRAGAEKWLIVFASMGFFTSAICFLLIPFHAAMVFAAGKTASETADNEYRAAARASLTALLRSAVPASLYVFLVASYHLAGDYGGEAGALAERVLNLTPLAVGKFDSSAAQVVSFVVVVLSGVAVFVPLKEESLASRRSARAVKCLFITLALALVFSAVATRAAPNPAIAALALFAAAFRAAGAVKSEKAYLAAAAATLAVFLLFTGFACVGASDSDSSAMRKTALFVISELEPGDGIVFVAKEEKKTKRQFEYYFQSRDHEILFIRREGRMSLGARFSESSRFDLFDLMLRTKRFWVITENGIGERGLTEDWPDAAANLQKISTEREGNAPDARHCVELYELNMPREELLRIRDSFMKGIAYGPAVEVLTSEDASSWLFEMLTGGLPAADYFLSVCDVDDIKCRFTALTFMSGFYFSDYYSRGGVVPPESAEFLEALISSLESMRSGVDDAGFDKFAASALISRAYEYFMKNNAGYAVRPYLERMLELAPESVPMRAEMILQYYNSGNYAKALAHLEMSLKNSPENESAIKKAISHVKELIEKNKGIEEPR